MQHAAPSVCWCMTRKAAHLCQDLLKEAQRSWAVAVLVRQPGLLQLVIHLRACDSLQRCQLCKLAACLQACSLCADCMSDTIAALSALEQQQKRARLVRTLGPGLVPAAALQGVKGLWAHCCCLQPPAHQRSQLAGPSSGRCESHPASSTSWWQACGTKATASVQGQHQLRSPAFSSRAGSREASATLLLSS